MRRKESAALLAIFWLAACSAENFDIPGARGDDAAYSTLFPYYAEFCALSQIKKKPGFGADIRGEIGGHAVFYLNGACRDGGDDYPVLLVCADAPADRMDGVGISMNAHFSNAKWAAIPGRTFFFQGDLDAGDRLTREAYQHTQIEAKRRRIYDAIDFHAGVFDAMPTGMARRDYKYEVSIATDYAIEYGRGRYCNRIPVTRAQMARMVDYLNQQNAPYRDHEKVFRWNVFQDNCIHLAHNALAAAGIWDEWPIDRYLVIAIFDFPVPKNEFVNVVRRTNDFSVLDPAVAYQDDAARRSLRDFGVLPVGAGAIADAHPPVRRNDVYDTDLKLIFYDEPNFGSYQRWLDTIFATPRYFDLRRNLASFVDDYGRVLAARPPMALRSATNEPGTASNDSSFTDFETRFYNAIEQARTKALAALETFQTDEASPLWNSHRGRP